jgi:sugar lactone lactonase YvrE
MTEPAETTSGPARAPGQAPTSPWQERLELGEGARWVDGRLILVDILSGRLLADGRIGRALETLGEPRLFADFARVPGAPDGMAVDSAGAVWIACWGGGTVRRYLPDGTPDRVIQFPAAQPTAVCLGGPDGLNPPGAHDGAVFTIPVTVPGLPAAAFQAKASVVALLEESRSAGRDVRSEAGW